jgi:hypothetical protein
MPIGETKMVNGREHDLTNMLSTDDRDRGLRLIERQPYEREDPVYLIDSDGIIQKRWDYIPSMGEVDDACKDVKP